MSDTIRESYATGVRVIQQDPAKWFTIGEKTVCSNGTWAECDGEHTLTMGDNGQSGTLRFENPQGEYFLVALGVSAEKHIHWCDILTDLTSSDSGVEIYPEYYGDGQYNKPPKKTWTYDDHQTKESSQGTTFAIDFYKDDGNNFYATITISYPGR